MQRYDLIAFALLAFVAILSVALNLSAGTFLLKDWQPLMASFVALGAASLAYKAAMEKVEFDRDQANETRVRAIRGSYLKLNYATLVLGHEARFIADNLLIPPANKPSSKISSDTLNLKEIPPAILEAWDHIEVFPAEIADSIENIRIAFYNLDLVRGTEAKDVIVWTIGPLTDEVNFFHSQMKAIIDACEQIRTALKSRLSEN